MYHSVNVITGEYCEAQTDFEVGKIIPLRWCRSYDKGSWSFNHPNFCQQNVEAIPVIQVGERKIIYSYDQNQRLSAVKIANQAENQTFAELKIQYSSPQICEITVPDGRVWRYDFYQEQPGLLQKFTRPDGFSCCYRYRDHPTNSKEKLIIAREEPEGRYLLTEYYEDGPACGKVKLQKAPLGHDHTPIIMHHFVYGEGYTEVYDALNKKVIYRYSQAGRLTAIEQYDDQEVPYRTERFFWDDALKPHLISRALSDAQNNVTICRTFAYDSEDHLTKETLYGNLSGTNNTPIILDSHGLPCLKGIEHYSIQYEYLNSLLVRKTDDNGCVTRFLYHPHNQKLIAKLTGEGDRIFIRHFYSYDENGVLVEALMDDGVSVERNDLRNITERHIKKYTLNSQNSETVGEYYFDLLSQQERLLKNKRSCYSPQGQLIQEETYDANDALYSTQHYQYDSAGRCIECFSSSDKIAQVTKYDTHSNKVASNQATYLYDFSNRLIGVSETDQNEVKTTSHIYDYLSNKIKTYDCRGNATTYSYDAFGRLITTTYPAVLNEVDSLVFPTEINEYDIFNNIISKTDFKGLTTETIYNAYGKPVEITYPDHTRETFKYNLDGTLRESTTKNGIRITYQTDFLGRVTFTECFDSLGDFHHSYSASYTAFRQLTAIDPQGVITKYDYDGAGRKIACSISTKDEVRRTAYSYDALGYLYETLEWFGKEDWEYTRHITKRDSGEIIESRIEDSAGNILQKNISPRTKMEDPIVIKGLFQNDRNQSVLQTQYVDAKGCLTTTTFDALDRVESLVIKNSIGKIIARQVFRYDLKGNKARESHDLFQGEQLLKTFTVLWTYGPQNQLESITQAAGSSQQTMTTYQYDCYGRLENLIKSDGISLAYTYDALGRVERLYASDNSFNYRYQYDTYHNIMHVSDEISGMTASREYNAFQQIIKETQGNDLAINYRYDGQGRTVQLTLPDGSAINYDYDALHLKAIHRITTNQEIQYSHRFTSYDELGLLSKAQLIENLGEISYNYDTNSKISGIQTPYWSIAIPENGRTTSGNISKLSIQTPLKNYSFEYLYDDLNNLVQEEGETCRSYDYDSVGNRTNHGSFVLDERNQLLETPDASYIYNVNGCLIEKNKGETREHYQYDALNRLIGVINKEYTINYVYDAFGRRITKKVLNHQSNQSQKIFYLYDGENEIGTVGDDGSISELQVLSPCGKTNQGTVVAIELQGETYAVLQDFQGSICCLINTETKSPEFYNYSAFGEAQVLDCAGNILPRSEAKSPWGFSGKRFDRETELIYFGKRYYDPTIGRWITPDPLGFIEGPNLYAFCGNNPLHNRDLYGLFSFSDFWNSVTSAIENFFQSFIEKTTQAIQYIRDQCSFSKIQSHLDQIGEQLFGKTFLAMMGCYNPEALEKGIYGSGEVGNIRITAINGILNLREHCAGGVALLSDAHGGVNVHYIFYPSEGWTKDLFNVVLSKLGYVTPHAKLLAATWKDLIQEMGGTSGNGLIIHYAHSIGGTNTEIAKSLLTPEEQKMIRVITIGSATVVAKGGFESVTNYISHRDGVIMADFFGYFKALIQNDSHVICIGSPWGIPLIDHLLTMETYRRLIEVLGQQFCETYGTVK